ncbi:MAG TPA: PHB depolymerase family esterase [Acidisoma sp.]|uniref:extracellular catalytic domain type 1 short-chain-length polyhydroxyalkanoate depolymerase n=1 Tax=Acidisoma sp. TaxID=1872115 RepID=UPI002D003DE2|nr:PHB depolymerase family esterase [Acidisoma sp.]HTI03596.1 PHB depolymerase family esterase [Acidisoma sp.]
MASLLSQDGIFDHWMRLLPLPFALGFGSDEGEDDGVLTVIRDFGPNPGNLRLRAFLPMGLPAGAPLVVVLHGCKQSAGEYDRGSGWSRLAERFGFALLMPEQKRLNNPHLCFDWFQTEDVTRDEGEVASIAAMIRHMITQYRLDASQVFITGLSAGGGMTAAMLATYPELFAAGAIIAGVPYGSATNAHEAFGVMGQGRVRTPEELGERVRAASPHAGTRPAVSIWQGEEDRVVNPVNALELAKQWSDVLGLAGVRPEHDRVDSADRSTWRDASGRIALSLWRIAGLGHATPIDPMAPLPEARIGLIGASPFVLPAGISSTWRIAENWGLTARRPARPDGARIATGAEGFWQHLLPGADRLQAAARDVAQEVAGPETPLGRLLRSAGITPPGSKRD